MQVNFNRKMTKDNSVKHVERSCVTFPLLHDVPLTMRCYASDCSTMTKVMPLC